MRQHDARTMQPDRRDAEVADGPGGIGSDDRQERPGEHETADQQVDRLRAAGRRRDHDREVPEPAARPHGWWAASASRHHSNRVRAADAPEQEGDRRRPEHDRDGEDCGKHGIAHRPARGRHQLRGSRHAPDERPEHQHRDPATTATTDEGRRGRDRTASRELAEREDDRSSSVRVVPSSSIGPNGAHAAGPTTITTTPLRSAGPCDPAWTGSRDSSASHRRPWWPPREARQHGPVTPSRTVGCVGTRHEGDRRQHQDVGQPITELVVQLAAGMDRPGAAREGAVQQVQDRAGRRPRRARP